MSKRAGSHKGQRGVALVEFAIVVPVLLLLVFAVWEFGRIFDSWLVVTNAAREGARYAAEGETNISTRVQNYVTSGYGARLGLAGDIQSVVVTVDRPDDTGPVTVTVRAAVDMYAPLQFVPGVTDPFIVSGYAVMRQ